jgi:hypothetical protein
VATSADVVKVLLSAGGLASFAAVWKGVNEWRDGTWKRRSSALADLERWRDESDDARRMADYNRVWAETLLGHARAYIATLIYTLNLNGIKVPPEPKLPDKPEPPAAKVRKDDR